MVYLSPGISQTVVSAYLAKTDLPPDPLTSREREVLQLIAEGKTTKEIADLLVLSVSTVQTHSAHILAKLGLHSRTELVKFAIRQGIITLDP